MWEEVIVRGTVDGALYALIAVGLNLQYGVTKILNVAYGQFLLIGSLITVALFNLFGVNPIISLTVSAIGLLLLGFLVYPLVFRKIVLESKSTEEIEVRSLLICFGLLFTVSQVMTAIILRNPRLLTLSINFLKDVITVLGVKIELNRIVTTFISLIISMILYVMLRYTRIGLALRAASQEPTGAKIVGVNISRVHLISFCLSLLLASIAGSLASMINPYLTSAYASQYTFIALTIIVLGGAGSFIGSLVGGFLMGYIIQLVLKFEPLLAMPVVYIFLVAILIIRPKGLFGR